MNIVCPRCGKETSASDKGPPLEPANAVATIYPCTRCTGPVVPPEKLIYISAEGKRIAWPVG